MFKYVICLLLVFANPALANNVENTIELALVKEWGQALASVNQSGNSALSTLVNWLYVQDANSGASFNEISFFLDKHPNWPDNNKIRLRAERALRDSDASDADIIAWFDSHPPLSGVGKWTYVEALKRQKLKTNEQQTLIKEAWKDADLTEAEENSLLLEFGDQLSVDDHIARIDRLLWEGKATSAQHLIPKVPVKYQSMFQARASLIKEEKNAAFLVEQVLGQLRTHPGLLYDRLRYRVKRNDSAGVREILLMTPKDVPYPERWWKIREQEVRKAIDEGNYIMAGKLLKNHSQIEGSAAADALWLSGWLKLEFLNAPKEAYGEFTKMYDTVKFPVSKARAAYWAGRAAKTNGDAASATNWFTTAAKHPTTFYGQLATTELSSSPEISLPDEPSLGLFSSATAFADDLGNAVELCIKNGQPNLATRLINHIIETSEDDQTILSIAALGHSLGAPQISVKAAKKASQQGITLKNVGYPRPDTAKDLPIERALTLAITRQESEFDVFAKSSANALGLMQLLPSTAKETAKKIDMPYTLSQLYDAKYNTLLGSHYLSRLVNAFEGSYVLAIASYNAGPGNVSKWIKQFGSPNGNAYEVVNWVEKIPFTETRNYVQRVLENVQVYRELENSGAKLDLANDLVR